MKFKTSQNLKKIEIVTMTDLPAQAIGGLLGNPDHHRATLRVWQAYRIGRLIAESTSKPNWFNAELEEEATRTKMWDFYGKVRYFKGDK